MRRGFLNSKGTRKPEVVGESFKGMRAQLLCDLVRVANDGLPPEATQTPAKADLASTVDSACIHDAQSGQTSLTSTQKQLRLTLRKILSII